MNESITCISYFLVGFMAGAATFLIYAVFLAVRDDAKKVKGE